MFFFVELSYTEQKISTTPINTPIKNIKLTELEKNIMDRIIDNPKISINKLSDVMNIGRDTIAEYIDRLKKKMFC